MAVITVLVTFLVFQTQGNSVSTPEQRECPLNHFRLGEMEKCHPWITCGDIDNISVIKRLGTGAIKDVFLIDWKGYFIVISVPVNPHLLEDFISGVEMLKLLNPSKYIVQFLGYCDKNQFLFTEYHPAGNAADFFHKNLSESNSVIQSLSFCHQYSLILNHIHNGPAGRRVLCDSNSLDKLLSQLLVTSDLRLILNDVDALPKVVNGSGVKCGHQPLKGKFVAPEQLWMRNDKYIEELMPGYNEKTDIWKAAAVCEFFLKRIDGGDILRYRLFDLHSKCRSHEPSLRPTSEELVNEYKIAIEEFDRHSEL